MILNMNRLRTFKKAENTCGATKTCPLSFKKFPESFALPGTFPALACLLQRSASVGKQALRPTPSPT
jgi:hypothetical protein